MTIILKKCTSEKNHFDRQFTGTDKTVEGTLRYLDLVANRGVYNYARDSVMDPVIQITGTTDILGYNYLDIAAFGRKYWVVDTPVLVNGLWEITAHVDVIGTWLTEIKNAPAMADEREKAADLYIDDGHVFVENREINQFKKFKNPEGHFADENDDGCFPPQNWEYVLITQGPGWKNAPGT